jgi:hypothetical protein
VNPPIVVPDSGGSFDYEIQVENLTSSPRPFDLWTQIFLPEAGSIEPMLVLDYTLPGLVTITRGRTQTVPGFAPAGTYTYYACIGDYPWVIEDYDSFTFEKSGGGGSLGSVSDWFCSGEEFDEWINAPAVKLPTEIRLYSAYPNPFNPTTTIVFALSDPGKVLLTVYDINGRLVSTPVDGCRNAGVHEVTFEASSFASGIYIYRLSAGDFTASGKMLLLK